MFYILFTHTRLIKKKQAFGLYVFFFNFHFKSYKILKFSSMNKTNTFSNFVCRQNTIECACISVLIYRKLIPAVHTYYMQMIIYVFNSLLYRYAHIVAFVCLFARSLARWLFSLCLLLIILVSTVMCVTFNAGKIFHLFLPQP